MVFGRRWNVGRRGSRRERVCKSLRFGLTFNIVGVKIVFALEPWARKLRCGRSGACRIKGREVRRLWSISIVCRHFCSWLGGGNQ